MISRYFCLRSEFSGAIAKRLPHAKNQLSAPGSFFNSVYTIYINIYKDYRISFKPWKHVFRSKREYELNYEILVYTDLVDKLERLLSCSQCSMCKHYVDALIVTF